MEVIIYVLEQKFPHEKAMSWYEVEEYKTQKEGLDYIKKLKHSGKSGFRLVQKRITLSVIKEI